MTFVGAEKSDLFVVYQQKKLLFRSYSEAYYSQENVWQIEKFEKKKKNPQ